ncbi:hypothetical protein [Streptomyces hainanensis]|uniref:Uncharacterized protein n=1 Tax=Streptomyces hainanensis TaxID=402648 RepID=A0A4R4T8X1_9ACTN|nr:hypothetical protein [Streptomyces hainanensis]TDC71153.1 hypothetical protein E1283_23900 [Streptomyces hainanensis]
MTQRALFGLSAGTRGPRTADHLLHRLAETLPLPPGAHARTHVVRTPEPGLALSIELPDPARAAAAATFERLKDERDLAVAWGDRLFGPAERRAAAVAALAGHDRSGARAVLFPGSAGLSGTLTLAELFDRTAIDSAVVLGGVVPEPSATLDTRGHVRPELVDGRLLLRVAPARGGVYVPFELPDPHPCCGGEHDAE